MSLKFVIRNTSDDAEKDHDGTIVRYSGVSEAFKRLSDRACTITKVDVNREPIEFSFVTGLDEKKVDYYYWYTDEEKKVVKDTIKDLKTVIEDYYGGSEVLDPKNFAFWKLNPDVSKLSIRNDLIDVFYDTKNPAHALLYLSIIGGAFIDTVSPTEKWAREHELPHYLALETDDPMMADPAITKSDAHAALAQLRKEEGIDALLILAWCTQYETNSFSAYSRSSTAKDLVNFHIQYIEGKLVTKKKKDTPRVFLEYFEKWNGQQTRPELYAEAYVKAGDYFNFLPKIDGRFMSPNGQKDLGGSIDEVVKKITKKAFTDDFIELRDKVEGKWKE